MKSSADNAKIVGAALEQPVASRELCFYCFDVIISSLEKTTCAPPDFPDGECISCITWAKRKEGNLNNSSSVVRGSKETVVHSFEARGSLITPLQRLHSEEFVRSIRDSAFRDPRLPPITSQDISLLRVSVWIINESKTKTLTDPEDWEIGKHGIRVEFEFQGKPCSAFYPPETILARGWSKAVTILEAIKKAGYPRESTPEFMSTVKISRIETSTCKPVSFQDYLKHCAEQDKQGREGKMQFRDEEHAKTFETIQRRRKRYIKAWSKRVGALDKTKPPTPPPARGFGFGKYTFVLIITAMILGIFVLRLFEVTYDADYDEFQSNYAILEVEPDAPFALVTKSFKKLSLRLHPDKCPECVEKYYAVSAAYQAISDYEKGILKLVHKPGTTGKPTFTPKHKPPQ